MSLSMLVVPTKTVGVGESKKGKNLEALHKKAYKSCLKASKRMDTR